VLIRKESKFKNLVYGVLEVLTFGRGIERNIGGSEVRFPVKFCRYYPKDYEPFLFSFLRNRLRPSDVFLDCGAHLELFSVTASRIVGDSGTVMAFKPMPRIREVCQRVLRMNGCNNVILRPEAIAAEVGEAEFFDTGWEASNANSLVKQDRHLGSIKVPVTTIDEVRKDIGRQINCIKIDVEGAEYDLLRGAEDTLKNDRPKMFLSMHPPALRNAGIANNMIWEHLRDLGYELHRFNEPVTKEWFVTQEDLFDVECLPEEMTKE
jgi:FkbM family methyltransferase